MIVCSGPRQVINAATLYSVYDADLANKDATSIDRSLVGFFENIKQLAEDDYQQVLILAAMAFTLIIWVFSALFLIAAVLFYVLFLWHWIPRADGGLSGYCARKVNASLVNIVKTRVNKALEKEQKSRLKAEYKHTKATGEKPTLARQATLPTIPDLGPGLDGDKLPEMPTMQRSDTYTTLPPYASRPGTPGSIEMNAMDQKRAVPSRTGTSSSKPYSARAGLVANASEMGTSSPLSPAPSVPSVDYNRYGSPAPISPSAPGGYSRAGTQPSNGLRHQTSTSSSSFGARYAETPSNYVEMPYPAPARSPTARPDGYGNLPPIPQGSARPFSPVDGRSSPASSVYSNRSGPTLPRNPGQHQSPLNGGGFQAYQPGRSAMGPAPYRPQQQQPQQQPSQGSAFDYDLESQRRY